MLISHDDLMYVLLRVGSADGHTRRHSRSATLRQVQGPEKLADQPLGPQRVVASRVCAHFCLPEYASGRKAVSSSCCLPNDGENAKEFDPKSLFCAAIVQSAEVACLQHWSLSASRPRNSLAERSLVIFASDAKDSRFHRHSILSFTPVRRCFREGLTIGIDRGGRTTMTGRQLSLQGKRSSPQGGECGRRPRSAGWKFRGSSCRERSACSSRSGCQTGGPFRRGERVAWQ